MLLQAKAMLVDAYRELNHKKLFWIVLILSGIIVAAFGIVGINDKGLTVLHWEFPGIFTTKWIPEPVFYKLLFTNLGIKWWLAWIASILALVSTAGLFPDFLASGSIELTLSRPIGRLRLFLYKYACGLLFVALQVSVFALASFLVIGLRGKTWEPGVLLAIPITVAIFSFLYCVCVLLGVLTRSTIASLLLTMLFWFLVFGVHATEQSLLFFKERNALQVESTRNRIEADEARAQRRLAENKPKDGVDPATGLTEVERDRLESRRKRLVELQSTAKPLSRFHTGFYALKTVLPKTTETAELLERALLSKEDREQLRNFSPGANRPDPEFGDNDAPFTQSELGERVENETLSRSVGWVLGSSLGFECFVLGIAAWIFARRDF